MWLGISVESLMILETIISSLVYIGMRPHRTSHIKKQSWFPIHFQIHNPLHYDDSVLIWVGVNSC